MQTYSDSTNMFISGKTLALWTTILLAANALLGLIRVGFRSLQLFLISAQPEMAAAALSDDDIDFSEMPGGGLQLVVLLYGGAADTFNPIIVITTGIVFLIWEYRANSNLPWLGVPGPEVRSMAVVGSWFVPGQNLMAPLFVMRIWHESDPDTVKANGRFGGWNYSGAGELTFKAWWGFCIATVIVNGYYARSSRRVNELNEYLFASWVGIFASMLIVITALLAIRVVRGVNTRQEERHKRLMAASQPQFGSQPYSASVAPPNVR